jgi:hypothetical protein
MPHRYSCAIANPERWAEVNKHVVAAVKYQTSEEILAELQGELIEMKALPAPEEDDSC